MRLPISIARCASALFLALFAVLPAAAAEPAHRNVYAAGGDVRTGGPVQGDFVAAGGRILLDQPVGRDANVAGGSVEVRAPIGEDLRVVGGDVAVAANVGGEMFAAGGNVAVRSGAAIAGPARIRAGSALVEGRVDGDLDGAAQKFTLNGEVRGNVRVAAEEIELGPLARIAGTLEYATASELKKAPGATVAGAITRTLEPVPAPDRERRRHARGPFWAGGVFTFVALLACTALLLLVAPGFAARAPLRIQASPWLALGLGFAALLAVPVVAVLLCITLLGIPLAIAVMALYPVLLLAGFLLGVLFLAGLLPPALRRAAPGTFGASLGYAALALALVLLVARVPFVGALVMGLVSLAGIGAGVLEWRGRRNPPAAGSGAETSPGRPLAPPELPRHA